MVVVSLASWLSKADGPRIRGLGGSGAGDMDEPDEVPRPRAGGGGFSDTVCEITVGLYVPGSSSIRSALVSAPQRGQILSPGDN